MIFKLYRSVRKAKAEFDSARDEKRSRVLPFADLVTALSRKVGQAAIGSIGDVTST